MGDLDQVSTAVSGALAELVAKALVRPEREISAYYALVVASIAACARWGEFDGLWWLGLFLCATLVCRGTRGGLQHAASWGTRIGPVCEQWQGLPGRHNRATVCRRQFCNARQYYCSEKKCPL